MMSTTAKPTVSIAMATYNGARFIEAQLRSLADQTLRPMELVVSDDGSTDGTLDIVRAFAATAPFPVRIYQNLTRLGHADNFFRAQRLCQGDWIAFCDQDDVWLPEKLEVCVAGIMKVPGVTYVAHRARVVDENLKELGRLVPPINDRGRFVPQISSTQHVRSEEMPPARVIHGFLTMVLRDLVAALPPDGRPLDPVSYDGRMAHDQWIYLVATAVGTSFLVSESLALYRRHRAAVMFRLAPKKTGRLRVVDDAANCKIIAGYLDSCGEYLASLSQFLSQSPRGKMLTAARRYAAASKVFTWRSQIYTGSLSTRLGALRTVLFAGGYSSRFGGLISRKGLAKDIVYALLGRKLVLGILRLRVAESSVGAGR